MKSLLLIISLVLTLFAEPSFQDVQSMIEHQQFKQAKLALTVINNNHPNSSKVYYTLAQANAGLGDLPAAKDALDKAKAINPSLDFVPSSQVALLEQAITPQAHLVKPVESSHTLMFIFVFSALIGGSVWYFFIRKPKPTPKPEQPSHKYSYTPPSRPTTSSGASSTTYTSSSTYVDPTPSHTEVHHHHHSDSSMGTVLTAGLTAAAVSSMMDHHQSTPVVIHEYPEYTSRSTSSSWEDSKPSRSSTWDDDSSSTRSSSWNDSSSSSSSWSDSSSSSSFSSSSSWD